MKTYRLARHHRLGTLLTTDENEIPTKDIFVLKHFSFDAMINAEHPTSVVEWMLKRYGQRIRPEEVVGWDILDPTVWKNRVIPAEYEFFFRPPVWSRETIVKGVGVTFGESAAFREDSTQSGVIEIAGDSHQRGEPFELKNGQFIAFSVARPYDDKLTSAEPEIFYKGSLNDYRYIVGPGGRIGLEPTSTLMVNEAEKTLLICPLSRLIGHTNGNDGTDSDKESRNILNLPEVKEGEGCASLGPWLVLFDEPIELTDPRHALDLETRVSISTWDVRNGSQFENDSYQLNRMQRTYQEIAWWVGRGKFFPRGLYAMCGTGCAKGKPLNEHHNIHIHSPGVGTLITGTQLRRDLRPVPESVRQPDFHV